MLIIVKALLASGISNDNIFGASSFNIPSLKCPILLISVVDNQHFPHQSREGQWWGYRYSVDNATLPKTEKDLGVVQITLYSREPTLSIVDLDQWSS